MLITWPESDWVGTRLDSRGSVEEGLDGLTEWADNGLQSVGIGWIILVQGRREGTVWDACMCNVYERLCKTTYDYGLR